MSLTTVSAEGLPERLLAACRSRRIMLTTAESCTGGLIAAALTAVAGSSDVVDRGFVTYSNAAKTELLGVPEWMIERDGAVSDVVARFMAKGALASAPGASLGLSVTGIAGPGGGSVEKPVGLVFLGATLRGGAERCERHVFGGDRAAIRAASVKAALALGLALVEGR